MKRQQRLIVVSNRLPVRAERVDGTYRLYPSDGGLVPALEPLLREAGGCWLGWTGKDRNDVVSDLIKNSGREYLLEPVSLTPVEQSFYYRGFSNEILWPLLHSLPSRCRFNAAYWREYCSVNEKFARTVANVSSGNDLIWVHDYHLMLQAEALRMLGADQHLAYFHHVPFPPPELFEVLPWRTEILRALLHFNTLGFQTLKDRNNFIACLKRGIGGVRVSHTAGTAIVRADGFCASVAACPISIDYTNFAAAAEQPEVVAAAEEIRSKVGHIRIALGVDRLDYTKGIPERLTAFRTLLDQKPEWRGRVTLLQIVVPSREEIPEYTELKHQIETMVSKINGEYSAPGWVPIQYFYRQVSRPELISFYRAADVALVTPLKDGMNLVAKEFCASRTDLRGVLLLSEFAGAACELHCGAVMVNPYDAEFEASAMDCALRMSSDEQRERMSRMRTQIQSFDVFRWARFFGVDCVADGMLAYA
jgi:trehalose 6-phosphate synthase